MPARIAPLFLLGVLACLLVALTLRTQRGSAAEETVERKIERLIADLGSDRFEVREAATRALMDLKDEPTALRKAVQSSDVEVRRRVEAILAARKRKHASALLSNGIDLCEEGRVVEMVDRMVCCKKWDMVSEEGWSALLRFSDRVIEASEPSFAPSGMGLRHIGRIHFPAGDFRLYKKSMRTPPKEFFGSEVPTSGRPISLVRGKDVSWGKMITEGPEVSVVAAAGNVRLGGAKWSFIVAGGDFKAVELFSSILICDGDVDVDYLTESTIVVARGKFTCRKGGGGIGNNMVRSKEGMFYPAGPKDPDPFAFVKFFELSDVGLATAERDPKGETIREGVGLKEVRKDSPFASQLRAGDVIEKLDGTKVASKEDFRRHLRRKLAQRGSTIIFTVRRSGETLNVPVPVKD